MRRKTAAGKQQEVAIDDLKTIQIRVSQNSETIASYRDLISENGSSPLPAITIYRNPHDGALWCADGVHRIEAHKAAGRRFIQAIIREGDQRDAILHAVGANAEHGLCRTTADKRKAVLTLLKDVEWADRSDRWIAETCHVSQPFVGKTRRQLDRTVEENTDGRQQGRPHQPPSVRVRGTPTDNVISSRVGKDGKRRRVPNCKRDKHDGTEATPPNCSMAKGNAVSETLCGCAAKLQQLAPCIGDLVGRVTDVERDACLEHIRQIEAAAQDVATALSAASDPPPNATVIETPKPPTSADSGEPFPIECIDGDYFVIMRNGPKDGPFPAAHPAREHAKEHRKHALQDPTWNGSLVQTPVD